MATGSLAPYGRVQYFDDDGAPLSGGLLYAYAAGTTTPLDTYTTSALTVANANPVVLDAAGRATVFLSSSAYKLVLKTAGGVTIWTVDNIIARPAFGTVLSKSTNYTVSADDGEDLLILCDASLGAITITLYAASGHSGNRVTVKKTDSIANRVIVDGNGGELVDTLGLINLNGANDTVSLECTGSGWKILSNYKREPVVCQGRLTVVSGSPLYNNDASGSALYFSPLNGNLVSLYDGETWRSRSFSEISLTLNAFAADTNFDIFLYDNSGTLTLEATAWTNATTRATGLSLQEGVYVKSGDTSRRYLGTIRTQAGGGTTADQTYERLVWNLYNQIVKPLHRGEASAASNWNYTTAVFRPWNNSTGNRVKVVVGLAEVPMDLTFSANVGNASAAEVAVGIGEDSTTTPMGNTYFIGGSGSPTGVIMAISTRIWRTVPLGFHFYQALEYSSAAGTTTWYGTNGTARQLSGLIGSILC